MSEYGEDVAAVVVEPEQDTVRPRWMAGVEEKAEFYADAWGLKPGQVKVALHDIFSMLFLHGAGPYEEVHCSKQIGELATVLMDEFGGPTRDESAVDMAIRLLRAHAPRLTVPSPDRSQP